MREAVDQTELALQHYQALPATRRPGILRSVAHSWVSCCPSRRLRWRLVDWSRSLDETATAAVTRQSPADEAEARELRDALGTLAVLEGEEEVRALAARMLQELGPMQLRIGDDVEYLRCMLRDMPLSERESTALWVQSS